MLQNVAFSWFVKFAFPVLAQPSNFDQLQLQVENEYMTEGALPYKVIIMVTLKLKVTLQVSLLYYFFYYTRSPSWGSAVFTVHMYCYEQAVSITNIYNKLQQPSLRWKNVVSIIVKNYK